MKFIQSMVQCWDSENKYIKWKYKKRDLYIFFLNKIFFYKWFRKLNDWEPVVVGFNAYMIIRRRMNNTTTVKMSCFVIPRFNDPNLK
jgi:hypothetical protein